MNHKSIAGWNLALASLIAISAIFFDSIRVFALIVFVSALGIYIYHAFIKKDNLPINRKRAYTTLLITLIICMALVAITYFIVPLNAFLIISGVILSLGGIICLLLLTKDRFNKNKLLRFF